VCVRVCVHNKERQCVCVCVCVCVYNKERRILPEFVLALTLMVNNEGVTASVSLSDDFLEIDFFLFDLLYTYI